MEKWKNIEMSFGVWLKVSPIKANVVVGVRHEVTCYGLSMQILNDKK